MSAEQVQYRIAAGDILEGRVRRADGTYERVKVLGMEKGCAEVEVLNPRNARTPRRRKLHYLAGVGQGGGCFAGYKLVERADGTLVEYPKHGQMPERAA